MATKEYLSKSGMQTILSKLKDIFDTKADASAIPSKTSDLENDSGFITTDTNTTYTLTQDETDGHIITLTPSVGDATTITIPDMGIEYESLSAASSGTDLSLVTTGEKYNWNNKMDTTTVITGGAQTTTSTASGGSNVYTFTMSDGTTSELTVKNGTNGTNATTTSVVSTSANGLAPKVTDTAKFLKGDGTWATPTDTKAAGSLTCTSANYGGSSATTSVQTALNNLSTAVGTAIKNNVNGTINSKNGEAGTQGYTNLNLGNATPVKTAENSAGRLRLYGVTSSTQAQAYVASITAGTSSAPLTGNANYILPPQGGWILTSGLASQYIVGSGKSGNYYYQVYNDGTVHIWGRVTKSITLSNFTYVPWQTWNFTATCTAVTLTAIDMMQVNVDDNANQGALNFTIKEFKVNSGNAAIYGYVYDSTNGSANTNAYTYGANVDIWGRGSLSS